MERPTLRMDSGRGRGGATGFVERLSEIDNDRLLSALNHGCGPEHDPVVRAYVDFAKSQLEEDDDQ